MVAHLAAPSLVQWGPYRPLVRFASGGMAEVWAAAKTGADGFEKIVAVKRMLPNLEDERFETMFHDEAQLAAHVRSPHVVSTIDLGRADDGSLYIAMELVNGVSLAHLLRQMGRSGVHIPAAVAVEILAQACQGLADAHEARMPDGTALDIVHRDVSPQNLLLDRSGVVRVTDFGVARAVERLSKTETGDMRGKVGYFSPEQSQGKEIDLRTDIFALGIVAHEMIAQKRLFRDENAWLTVQNVLTGDIPSLAGVRDVSAELDAVILRALERDKERRWQSARELGEALTKACRRSGPEGPAALVRDHASAFIDSLETQIRDAYLEGRTRYEGLATQSQREIATARAKGPAPRPATRRGRPSRVVIVGLVGGLGLSLGAAGALSMFGESDQTVDSNARHAAPPPADDDGDTASVDTRQRADEPALPIGPESSHPEARPPVAEATEARPPAVVVPEGLRPPRPPGGRAHRRRRSSTQPRAQLGGGGPVAQGRGGETAPEERAGAADPPATAPVAPVAARAPSAGPAPPAAAPPPPPPRGGILLGSDAFESDVGAGTR